MPTLSVNNCTYHYTESGDGEETIVFGHGFLLTHRMWEKQIEAFSDRYRCIRFDWRGQGDSEVTEDGYDVADLASDAAALIRELDAGPCHYVGLSMGGFVGFDLLLNHGDLLRSAVLMDTSAEAEGTLKRIKYQAMLRTVRTVGYEPVVDRVMPILFGKTYRKENPDAIERWKEIITSQDRQGIYEAGTGIFRRPSRLADLGQVRTPVLLLTGAEDDAQPPERAHAANDALPNSRCAILPNAGHISAVERPEAVNKELRTFLQDVEE